MSIWGEGSSDQLLLMIAVVAAVFIIALAAFVLVMPRVMPLMSPSQTFQAGALVGDQGEETNETQPVAVLKVVYSKE